jgi:hypothetical protein
METKVKYANGNFANLFLYESPTLLSGMNSPFWPRLAVLNANLVALERANQGVPIECKMFQR